MIGLQNTKDTAMTASTPKLRPAAAPVAFDYTGLDEQTSELLHNAEEQFLRGKKMAETGFRWMVTAVSLAHDTLCGTVVQLLDNGRFATKEDTFRAWCASIGIGKSTAYNMLRVAERFGNIELNGQSILDVQPMTLLYEASKANAPEEVTHQVETGDITSHKQYQKALAQLKAKENELAQVKKNLDEEIASNDQLHEEKARLLQQCEASKAARITAEARAKADADKINELVERNDELDYKLHVTRTDLGGLMEQNQKLTVEKEKLLDERDEHIRTIRKLESRPVEVMAPDEEEIDRLASERAVGLASARNAELADENAVLKGQIGVLQGFINDSVQEDCEMAHHFVESTEAAFEAVIPVYLRLPSGDRNRLCWKLRDLLSHIQDATEMLLDGKDPRFAQDALDEDDEWEEDEI